MAKDERKKDETKPFKGILTDAPEREARKRFKKLALKIAGVLILVAIIASLPKFFGPKAQVERSFNKCVKALEKLDRPAVMDFVSESFTNPLLTEKSALDTILGQIFNQFKSIKVHIIKKEIKIIDKGHAEIMVEGSIYFKDEKEQMFRAKSESPLVINLVKEDKKWRMVSVDGMSLDMISIMKEEFLPKTEQED